MILSIALATALAQTACSSEKDSPLSTVRVASGLESPDYVGAPPGDPRLFIIEQPGRIRILKDGALLETPFLDIHERVLDGGERGLLGLAFHPEFSANGRFYVNYTDNEGTTVVAGYLVSSDPDRADHGSELEILRIPQPFSNHNGGCIVFGPDGYLYVGMGDGGSAGDPGNRAQNPGELLGKLLRIDVDGGSPYAIPSDNPFLGQEQFRPEIWALGMRNPWRFSFDRLTGDLYIADVGQNEWEEIDFQPASSGGGENYGWRFMEGSHCYDPPSDCDDGDPVLEPPIHEYNHQEGCSVTGGHVYRGQAIRSLQGLYFFADYCSASIWSFRFNGTTVTEFKDRTRDLAPASGRSIGSISSFGEDGFGELYIVDHGGEVYKVVSRSSGKAGEDEPTPGLGQIVGPEMSNGFFGATSLP